MTDQATRVVPAGWYDDPASPARVRWWNGIAWTEHVADKPSAEDQAAAAAREAQAREAAAQQTAGQHAAAQHSAGQHSAASHSATSDSAAEHSAAQHSAAQHSAGQHSAAQQAASQQAAADANHGLDSDTAAHASGAATDSLSFASESTGILGTGTQAETQADVQADAADRVAAARRMELEFGIGTSETPVVGSTASDTFGVPGVNGYGAGTDDTAWRSTATGSIATESLTTGSIPAVDGRRRDLPDRYLLPDAGTSTGPAWLIALSPLLTLVLAAAAGYVYLFFFPEPLIFAAVGVVYLLALLWALADVRTLRARGFEPASALFTLLGAFVYLIARRVRVSGSGPLVTFLLLGAAAIGAPVAAYATGFAQPMIVAIEVQDTLQRELVGSGSATSVSCPLVLGSTAAGTTYTCEAVMPTGTERLVWVSLDNDSGGFSYAYAVN